MKNPFQTAPRCIQWAAVLMVAVSAFNAIIVLQTLSFGQFMALWPSTLPYTAVTLVIAAGLIYGLNAVRLVFTAVMLFMIGDEGIGLITNGLKTISPVAYLAPKIIPCIALGLCWLPRTAALYFAGEYEPEVPERPANEERQTEEPNANEPNKAHEPKEEGLPIKRIILVLVVRVGGVMLQKHYQNWVCT